MQDDKEPVASEVGALQMLGPRAFVVVENANCLFEPRIQSAVCIIPPYGTEVEVIRDNGEWVLIKVFCKEAWSPRSHLGKFLTTKTDAEEVGILPNFDQYYRHSVPSVTNNYPEIFYGPRGGRYIRTALGFRRYF